MNASSQPQSLANRDDLATGKLSRLLGYLKEDPENLSLRGDIFDLSLASGEFNAAHEQVAWTLGRDPADYAWRHRLAMLDMAREEWDEARLLLQSLVAEGQSDPVVAYNLAYVEFAQGLLDQAVLRLEPLVEAHLNRLPMALPLLLRCLHRQGAINEGLDLFYRYASRVNDADSLGVASLLAIDANQLDWATQWADRALALDARQHEALVAKATALLGARDAQGALQLLQAAQAEHPRDGRTLSAVGMANLLAINLEASHAAFTQAVEFMPSHIGTWHGLGWCEILRKDLPAARRAYEKALALDDNFGESHGGLAVVLAMQGHVKQAEESIRRALKLDPLGLSARFAQTILSGEVRDSERFARLARAALGQRRDASGKSLADIVLARR